MKLSIYIFYICRVYYFPCLQQCCFTILLTGIYMYFIKIPTSCRCQNFLGWLDFRVWCWHICGGIVQSIYSPKEILNKVQLSFQIHFFGYICNWWNVNSLEISYNLVLLLLYETLSNLQSYKVQKTVETPI